jgi:hypothetical protein
MLEALKTTRGNIQSLGPAGCLDEVWPPYRIWLHVVSQAIEAGEHELDPH